MCVSSRRHRAAAPGPLLAAPGAPAEIHRKRRRIPRPRTSQPHQGRVYGVRRNRPAAAQSGPAGVADCHWPEERADMDRRSARGNGRPLGRCCCSVPSWPAPQPPSGLPGDRLNYQDTARQLRRAGRLARAPSGAGHRGLRRGLHRSGRLLGARRGLADPARRLPVRRRRRRGAGHRLGDDRRDAAVPRRPHRAGRAAARAARQLGRAHSSAASARARSASC